MNLESYQTLFMLITIGLAFVAVSPLLDVVGPLGDDSEKFSELWLLGFDNVTEEYPYQIGVNEEYEVTFGVGNHMGSSQYYMVYLKLSNSTEFLPDIEGSVASSLVPLCEFRFFVGDGEASETVVAFGIENIVVNNDVLYVEDAFVDGAVFPVDVSVTWDSKKEGYPVQLFFELWRYDSVTESFRFDDLYVSMWLNVRSS